MTTNKFLSLVFACHMLVPGIAQCSMQRKTMESSRPENIRMAALAGHEAKKYFEEIARIRITLFREYPYLYEGSQEYEREYLETYFRSANAVVLLVFDNDKVVGFSNSIPLAEESAELKAPFERQGLNLNDYLYIGEVMLYPEYRGQGFMRKFLEFHEDKARKEGYKYTVLMTVERPDDHSLRPSDYKSLDSMWRHFGYERLSAMRIHLAWTQVDTKREMENRLAIWQKQIT